MMLEKLKNNYKESIKRYDENKNEKLLESGSSMLFEKLIWVIDDVCRATTYKKGTIYNLVSSGSIPYRKRRGKLFFIPSEILAWIQGVNS
jgi:predicted DNA-binding transcriptional regulator AlpA